MRVYPKYFFFLITMGLSLSGCERLNAEHETFDVAQNVVNLVEVGRLDDAFALLKLHWPLSSLEVDELRNHTQTQRQVVIERYGNPIGVEFIKTEKVGDSMVRHTFIEKFDHHALKWQLSFYKPNEKWNINSVYWDDKISDLY